MRIFSLGYKVFVTAVNGQVSGLLSKYLAAATQHYAAASGPPTSPTPITGVPGPPVGDLQRRRTEPALANRNRIVSQHNSMPVSGGPPDTSSSNGGIRRPSKVLSPRASTESGVSSVQNGNVDTGSTDDTEETEVGFGKAEVGASSASSGASITDAKKKGLVVDGGGGGMRNAAGTPTGSEEAVDGQGGCVII